MERFFKSIRNGDLDDVRALLDAHPELLHTPRTKGPKKDMGQQPLGIALKKRRYDIARLLLERGADVNFIEAEDVPWQRAYVIDDAVESAVATSIGPDADKGDHREALAILEEMIQRGAQVDRIHPVHGRPNLDWFVLRVLDYRRDGLDPKQVRAVTGIAQILIDAGADPDQPYTLRLFSSTGEVLQEHRTSVRGTLRDGLAMYRGPVAEQLLEIFADCQANPGRSRRRKRWWRRG